ncbi:MAG: hypothetical protein ACLTYN_12335 [Dysosmobacter welbionis]
MVWSDLDGNGHVYSGNYGDFVWDYLPADLQEKVPREFFINYSKEATLGQEPGWWLPQGRRVSDGGPGPGGRLLLRPVRVLRCGRNHFPWAGCRPSAGGGPAGRGSSTSTARAEARRRLRSCRRGGGRRVADRQRICPATGTGSQRSRLWSPGRWCRSCGAPWRSCGADGTGWGSSAPAWGPGSACWHIRTRSWGRCSSLRWWTWRP